MSAPTEDTWQGTTAVREAHRFDEAALERWLYANITGFEGPVLVDVRVTREENTYPMIPAGQPARNMVG